MPTMDPLSYYNIYGSITFLFDFITGSGGPNSKGFQLHNNISIFFDNLPYYLVNIFARFTVFSIFFCIALVVLIIIYLIRENKIRENIMQKVIIKPEEVKDKNIDQTLENPKWKLVEEHINSDDSNKWKLAILEADIILSEMLERFSLPGESVGEKLKAVEPSDFDTLDQAWEAHKIRNAIAHQGSDFILNQREAKRVIGLYSEVFKEFEII